MLPIVVSVAAPVAVLSAGAVLTVVVGRGDGIGMVWVLERASDGARASITSAGRPAGALGRRGNGGRRDRDQHRLGAFAAGEAIAFIPNEIGAALLYNERITR